MAERDKNDVPIRKKYIRLLTTHPFSIKIPHYEK